MALFSFRHSVKAFSDKRTAGSRIAKAGQTAAHLRYITRPKAARLVLRRRLTGATDTATSQDAEQAAQKRKGRVCERFIIALPIEASSVHREALARAFAERLTKGIRGYVAALHDQHGNDLENPHFHLAAFDVMVKSGGRGRPKSTLGMARKHAIENTAKMWADLHNAMMKEWGYGPKSMISHLSLKDRGIDRIPTIHEGAAARAMANNRKEPVRKQEWPNIDDARHWRPWSSSRATRRAARPVSRHWQSPARPRMPPPRPIAPVWRQVQGPYSARLDSYGYGSYGSDYVLHRRPRCFSDRW